MCRCGVRIEYPLLQRQGSHAGKFCLEEQSLAMPESQDYSNGFSAASAEVELTPEENKDEVEREITISVEINYSLISFLSL
jgi:hypothetical protein